MCFVYASVVWCHQDYTLVLQEHVSSRRLSVGVRVGEGQVLHGEQCARLALCLNALIEDVR